MTRQGIDVSTANNSLRASLGKTLLLLFKCVESEGLWLDSIVFASSLLSITRSKKNPCNAISRPTGLQTLGRRELGQCLPHCQCLSQPLNFRERFGAVNIHCCMRYEDITGLQRIARNKVSKWHSSNCLNCDVHTGS